MGEVADIRARLAPLPAAISMAADLAPHIHMPGVRSQIATAVRRRPDKAARPGGKARARACRAYRPGPTWEVEKQVLRRRSRCAWIMPPLPSTASAAQVLGPARPAEGEKIADVEGGRAASPWWCACAGQRARARRAWRSCYSTPRGRVPPSRLPASRRLMARTRSADDLALAHRAVGQRPGAAALTWWSTSALWWTGPACPEGYFITLGRAVPGAESCSRLVAMLAVVSLALMFVALCALPVGAAVGPHHVTSAGAGGRVLAVGSRQLRRRWRRWIGFITLAGNSRCATAS